MTKEKTTEKENSGRFGGAKGVIRMIIFILIILAVLFAMLFTGRKKGGLVTAFVKEGSLNRNEEAKAYFIREEKGIKTEHAGKFVTQADEGEKVAKGQVIAYVVSDGMEETFAKMKAAERKLNTAKEAVYAYTGVYPDGYDANERGIRDLNEKLSLAAHDGNISEYEELMKEINELLKAKYDAAAGIENDSAYVEKLTSELETLKSQLAGAMYEITAPQAGIVSFYCDGTDKGTSSEYAMLAESEKNGDFSGIDMQSVKKAADLKNYTGKAVSAGDTVAAVISGSYCYVVADTGIASSGKVSFSAKKLGISGGGNVVYSDGKTTVIKCGRGAGTTTPYSSAEINITAVSENGMKVSQSALTDWDAPKSNARLTVIKNGIVRFIYVEVLAYDGEYAIVAPHAMYDSTGFSVKINDTYVVNYDKVVEGQTIT